MSGHLTSNPLNLSAPIPADMVNDSPYCDLHRLAGALVTCTKDVNGAGAAASVNLFQLTGTVELKALWGAFTDVTETTAITVPSFDLRDDAATVQLTAVGGAPALSGAGLGSVIAKEGLAATALAFNNSSAARVSESAFNRVFVGSLLTQKAGQDTFIRFTCTTDANTNVTIAFYAAWVCRYPGSLLVPV